MVIKIFLDEDVHSFIARALRLRGWDAMTAHEAGRLGISDVEQLRFAADNGRAVLTYNVRDFPRIHYEFTTQGASHAGIIVATQDDPRKNLRSVFNLMQLESAESLANQLVYLNNWA